MPRSPNRSTQTRDLLTALAQQPRSWRHGYDLSKQLGLKSGTLYPLLIRLSDQGLLADRWEESDAPGKPPRHAYKLTPNGLALARSISIQSASAVDRPLMGTAT